MDDLESIIDVVSTVTDMDQTDTDKMKELVREFDKIRDVEDMGDILDLTLEFEEINVEDIDLREISQDRDSDKFSIKDPEDLIDTEDSLLTGVNWVETEKDTYQTFVRIPDDYIDATSITIEKESNHITITEPFEKSISTEHIDAGNTRTVDAKKKGRFLLITVGRDESPRF